MQETNQGKEIDYKKIVVIGDEKNPPPFCSHCGGGVKDHFSPVCAYCGSGITHFEKTQNQDSVEVLYDDEEESEQKEKKKLPERERQLLKDMEKPPLPEYMDEQLIENLKLVFGSHLVYLPKIDIGNLEELKERGVQDFIKEMKFTYPDWVMPDASFWNLVLEEKIKFPELKERWILTRDCFKAPSYNFPELKKRGILEEVVDYLQMSASFFWKSYGVDYTKRLDDSEFEASHSLGHFLRHVREQKLKQGGLGEDERLKVESFPNNTMLNPVEISLVNSLTNNKDDSDDINLESVVKSISESFFNRTVSDWIDEVSKANDEDKKEVLIESIRDSLLKGQNFDNNTEADKLNGEDAFEITSSIFHKDGSDGKEQFLAISPTGRTLVDSIDAKNTNVYSRFFVELI